MNAIAVGHRNAFIHDNRELLASCNAAFAGMADTSIAAMPLVMIAMVERPWTTALTRKAYLKGMVNGIADTKGDCPYDAETRSNYQRGGNDASKAWKNGSVDGQRIRAILRHEPLHSSWKGLEWREYKTLPPASQAYYTAL